MAITQTIMRLVVRSGEDLQAEIKAANALLVANNREEMFTTLFCGVLDVASGTVTYCICGHNPPLVLRKGAETFERLENCGPPLGIIESFDYVPRSIALAAGDMLVLYTDGVTEAENAQSEQFGIKRLEQAVLPWLLRSTAIHVRPSESAAIVDGMVRRTLRAVDQNYMETTE